MTGIAQRESPPPVGIAADAAVARMLGLLRPGESLDDATDAGTELAAAAYDPEGDTDRDGRQFISAAGRYLIDGVGGRRRPDGTYALPGGGFAALSGRARSTTLALAPDPRLARRAASGGAAG